VYATRSRFLTNEVCEHFSRETWYPRSALPNGDRAETTKVDLQALLRDVWAPRASPASK
jgi:hypothetical protein